MDKIIDWTLENLPTGFIVILIFVAGVSKFGPEFIKKLYDVNETISRKSDLLSRELIAILKSSNQEKDKRIESLKEEVSRLRRENDKLKEKR